MTIQRKFSVTAQDVADLAGVSRSAVSRCFSGAGKVSHDKRERIFAAAEQLGYRPNAIARSLTGQKTDLVALVTTEHLSHRSNEHLSEMTLCLAEVGKRALVIPVGEHTTIDESSLRALDYKVDAIVIMGGSVSGRIVEMLKAARVPLFLFGRDHEGESSIGISCDNALGGAIAARFLVRAGRRCLAYIGKEARTFSDRSRRRGFSDELGRLGFAVHAEADDQTTYEGGRRAASKLFSAGDPPDALFCFNDTMAFGALQAAREFKLRVPEDVAVIGFDDQPMASWHPFELTTLGYDPNALARLATRKILDALERDEIAPKSFHIQPQLIVRRTTP
jgi:DNA-binding LacI/PurR family transcriptional regulator